MGIFKDIKALISGMGITGKHLGRHAVTIQYPEEKMEMPERSRGMVVLLSNLETGELNCTGCLLCEKACPTSALDIDAPRDPETKKRTVLKFTLDNSLCCYCGLCEEACNFLAIKMATKYEYSAEDKDDLFWDKDKLQEMGLDVKYTPKPKKKKVVPKKAAETGDKEKPEKSEAKADAPVKTESKDAGPTDKVEESKTENKENEPEAPPADKSGEE